MNKFSMYLILWGLVFILIGLYTINAKADMMVDYNTEVVEYIETEYTILPEYTKFVCNRGILYKNGSVQRKYTGIAQTCKTIKMTRAEHEITIINTLF